MGKKDPRIDGCIAKSAGFAKWSSTRRASVEWITEAKTEETRTRRLETAIEWMEEGKPRHWKYLR